MISLYYDFMSFDVFFTHSEGLADFCYQYPFMFNAFLYPCIVSARHRDNLLFDLSLAYECTDFIRV